jgi:uncharacterized membrane protein YphA (DoxX/SURF4 family)
MHALKPYALSRISLAVIWIYHGLVPKLLFSSQQEIDMNNRLLPFLSERTALVSSGISEVLYGLSLLLFFRIKGLVYPTLIFGTMATLALAVTLPHFFKDAFNPFSLNLAIITLAMINLVSAKENAA